MEQSSRCKWKEVAAVRVQKQCRAEDIPGKGSRGQCAKEGRQKKKKVSVGRLIQEEQLLYGINRSRGL